MISPYGLLFIEPSKRTSPEPLIDSLTRHMTAAWRNRRKELAFSWYAGFHMCKCGAISDNIDHNVGGLRTNSLCIHYLAFHREEVPLWEVAKVMKLPDEE